MTSDVESTFHDALAQLINRKEAFKSLPALRDERARLDWQLRGVEAALEQVEGEIRRLEGSILASLFGNKERNLEARREEEAAIRTERDALSAQIDAIDERIAGAEAEVDDVAELDRQIQRLYDQRAAWLREHQPDLAADLDAAQQQLDEAKSQRHCVEKAQQIGGDVRERLFSMMHAVGRSRTRGVNRVTAGIVATAAVNLVLQSQTAKPAVTRVVQGLEEFGRAMAGLPQAANDHHNECIARAQQSLLSWSTEVAARGAGGMVWDTECVGPILDSVQDALGLVKEIGIEVDERLSDCQQQWRKLLEQA